MNDWKPGDAAVCVFGGKWIGRDKLIEPGPSYGEIAIINSVVPNGDGDIFLGFAKWKPRLYWQERFRRIPPIEIDAADREIIEIMRRGVVKIPETTRLDINRALDPDSFQCSIRLKGR